MPDTEAGKQNVYVTTLVGRIFMGLFAVVCIALLYTQTLDAGQKEHFNIFLTSAKIAAGQEGNILAFIFSAIIAFGGVFLTTEKDAIRILIFAISLPSLITNLNVQNLAPGSTRNAPVTTQIDATSAIGGLLISPAYAQEDVVSTQGVCDEGTFLSRAYEGFGDILTVKKGTEQPIYTVVMASIKQDQAPIERLNALKTLLENNATNLTVALGCRKPENEYHPIIVLPAPGDKGLVDYARAQELLGEYSSLRALLVDNGLAKNEGDTASDKANLIELPVDPYISSYKFRQIIAR